MLLAPSVENLKSVTATLWDVMGGDNRMLDSLPLQRDVLNFGNSLMIIFTRPLYARYK